MPHRPAALLATIVLLGYVGVSRGVGDLYPFSTFSMYARSGREAVSRIVARTADGQAHPVRAFTDWSCDGPIKPRPARCEALGDFDACYLDTEDLVHLEAHRAPDGGDAAGAEPVELTRRVWRFRGAPGPLTSEDCLLHRCRARRVGP